MQMEHSLRRPFEGNQDFPLERHYSCKNPGGAGWVLRGPEHASAT